MTNSSTGNNEATALYRFFDERGTLLYVGITKSLPTRLRQHSDTKYWFSQVTDVKVEHFASRCEAEQAERAAIQAEDPLYNIVHSRYLPPARERPKYGMPYIQIDSGAIVRLPKWYVKEHADTVSAGG